MLDRPHRSVPSFDDSHAVSANYFSMGDPKIEPKNPLLRLAWFAASIIVFGVAMTVRAEAQPMWMRAGLAGLAGAALFVGIVKSRPKGG